MLDKISGITYLIDTGADISFLPSRLATRVFATTDFKICAANGTPITLIFGQFLIANVKQPILGYPPEKLKAAQTEINYILNKGICQPSSSSWASPLHMVRKKMVIGDYLIRRDEHFDNLRSWKSLLPNSDGTRRSSETVIITPFGLFEHNVMTFSLKMPRKLFSVLWTPISIKLSKCNFVMLSVHYLVFKRCEKACQAHNSLNT
ncbi:uncharacterized protein LOC143431092 [Xylocopa sonorina]|uniref:uncharacterized protein LOC143431092 n=1 Tax=Xylocopa sonorina TaxID=1818115 RepID=UPI00403B32F1